jgi:ABC-type amino acid transport substrate-binding protein
MDRDQRKHLRQRPVSRSRAVGAAATLVGLAMLGRAAPAAAQDGTITVGLFAPSAPFEGPVERLQFVSALAEHVADRVGAAKGIGRSYAKASDFAEAVSRGEVDYAVLDSPYGAARGLPFKVLATAVRGGSTQTAWVLVAAGDARRIADLKGKQITLPRIGVRDRSFLTRVLLGDEVAASFFAKVDFAPNALSALASVKLGRADAAFVPAGLALPDGARVIATAPDIGWPMLVALPSADADQSAKVAAAAASFQGGTVFSGFRDDNQVHRQLARRFTQRKRRGPMAVRPPQLDVKKLVENRRFALERADVGQLAPARPEKP